MNMADLTESLITSIEVPAQLFAKLLTAGIIIFIGLIVGRIVGKLIRKTVKRLEINKLLKRANINFDVEEFSEKISKWIIYIIAIFMALNELGIGTLVINIVLIAMIIIIIIIILLSLKDMIPNIAAGFYLQSKPRIKVGDKIKVGNIKGKVEYINLIQIRVRDAKGNIIVIPSSALTQDKFTIYKK